MAAPLPCTVALGTVSFSCDLSVPGVSLALPVLSTDPPTAFGIPLASSEPLRLGTWVGSVDSGSSVNCPTVASCFHGSGTHTECCGHILPGNVRLGRDVPFPSRLYTAVVLTVAPTLLSVDDAVTAAFVEYSYPSAQLGDRVVLANEIKNARDGVIQSLASQLSGTASPAECEEVVAAALNGGCLILRTLPNDSTKMNGWCSLGSALMRLQLSYGCVRPLPLLYASAFLMHVVQPTTLTLTRHTCHLAQPHGLALAACSNLWWICQAWTERCVCVPASVPVLAAFVPVRCGRLQLQGCPKLSFHGRHKHCGYRAATWRIL